MDFTCISHGFLMDFRWISHGFSQDVLWDLGCGDGVVLIQAAQRCGCRCVGLDIDQPWLGAGPLGGLGGLGRD